LFANASGNKYVAKWNGTTWSELGGSNTLAANNPIYRICSDIAGNVYAAGYFTNASGNKYVAKWDGANWSELGGSNSFNSPNPIYFVYADNFGRVFASSELQNSPFGKTYWAYYNTPIISNNCQAFYTLYPDSVLQSNWFLVNQCFGSDSLSADSLNYLWSWGDSLNSTATGAYPSFTYSSPGNYVICVTATDATSSCTSTYCDSSTYIFKSIANQMISVNVVPATTQIITKVKSNSNLVSEFSIYPNPAKDMIYIRYKNYEEEHQNYFSNIKLYDVLGNEFPLQNIKSKTQSDGIQQSEFNIQHLPKGIYFLKAGNQANMFVKE
jgi:hypothetical protein